MESTKSFSPESAVSVETSKAFKEAAAFKEISEIFFSKLAEAASELKLQPVFVSSSERSYEA